MKFFQKLSNLNQTSLFEKFLDKTSNENKIMSVERKATASECLKNFFDVVNLYQNVKNQPDAIMITAVGLKVDGRSSIFDLWWFNKDKNNFFAVDVKDTTFVASTINS